MPNQTPPRDPRRWLLEKPKQLLVGIPILLALPQCSVSEAPEPGGEQAAATSEAARIARRAELSPVRQTRAITRTPEDEQQYQKARELALSRGKERDAELVNQLGLAADARDKVLAELESELQARTQIVDYLRAHPGMRSADLVARSQEPGNAHLAELIERANPKRTQSRIRKLVGEEGLNRLSAFRQAGTTRAASGTNQTGIQDVREVTHDQH